MREWNTVSVIGMGYIGLPTCALLASRGISIIGVDVNRNVVDSVNRGAVHIVEPDLDGLVQKVVSNGKLRATIGTEPADAFIVAVPTPMTDDRKPDIRYVLDAARSIAPHLKKGNLVILESTSPVGTTRQVSSLLGELRPDLAFPHAAGDEADVLVAYSPERVLPGKILTELVQNDRSVGGLSPRSSEHAASLYASFVRGTIVQTTAETAELVKLAENAFRDVNIAFANELAAVCEQLNLDVWSVIDLANRHPRVSILQPGPGVGGHCIAVDPYFIISAAPDDTPLMQAARRVNSERPHRVAAAIGELAAGIENPVIACLGLAFKADIDDLRESPAVEIVELLARTKVGRIIASEPNIDRLPDSIARLGVEFRDPLSAIDAANIVVLLVDHRQFAMIDAAALGTRKLLDTRGLWTWHQKRRNTGRMD
ncbi:UDP-N-acetyl-D-mannosamine dehydrogenase [Parvibaculum sp.]|uniref:UDP-N-acetyl-D-mannosamine dehydrogenase n=1 Tax=Parvibaculum sp. TaxID=2024848 RepID=UPI001D563DA9|nr:UDP-N-acetyl-D-mannosamine dehydrogenase [Parvibaculum sp.]MBX3489203.1 UDP-N-acetyl-D-mannosamine dehydrogenase [Parvibaculum sp.]